MSCCIKIKSVVDKYGGLSFFEANKDINFDIKRVYYITNVHKNTIRGFHAHRKLQQMLFCPYGSIEIMLNDGVNKKYIILDNPSKGLIIEEGLWHEMKWLKDESVLCVVASEYYDENDYIRNYDEFIKLVKVGYWKK